ncbi:MAG: hypothetical protein NTV70_01975 [Acidobacteria bacterium]|nr:hypothetical protein [Acidobacteriota bacterium]
MSTILFAGGCHVVGYPFGPSFSFATLTVQVLRERGHDLNELATLPYLPLGHANQLTGPVARHQVHTLVLQIGHYETTLEYLIPKRFPSRQNSSEKVQAHISVGESQSPFGSLPGTVAWLIRNRLKYMADQLTGSYCLDTHSFQKQLQSFLGMVSGLAIPRTILLSPLPCDDLTLMSYRRKVNPMYAREAVANGFDYVDLLEDLWPTGTPRVKMHHDGAHLSKESHAAIACRICQHLTATMPQVRTAGLAGRS